MGTTRSPSGSVPASYFENKFQSDIDPWEFRTSAYEREKYAATVAALTRPRYASAFEAGCAIGVLSGLLAAHCDRLVAVDGSGIAIAEAKLQNLPKVQFRTAFLPDEFPSGHYDLIVLSEVLYYFSEADLARLAEHCVATLNPDGEIILCHWLGETDYPMPGRQASDLFVQLVSRRRPKRDLLHDGIYRLERLVFPPAGVDDAG
jgi:SAM-dependent methyltransferase